MTTHRLKVSSNRTVHNSGGSLPRMGWKIPVSRVDGSVQFLVRDDDTLDESPASNIETGPCHRLRGGDLEPRGGFQLKYLEDLELEQRVLDLRNPQDLRIAVSYLGECPERDIVECHLDSMSRGLPFQRMRKEATQLKQRCEALTAERSRIEQCINIRRSRARRTGEEDPSLETLRWMLRHLATWIKNLSERLAETKKELGNYIRPVMETAHA